MCSFTRPGPMMDFQTLSEKWERESLHFWPHNSTGYQRLSPSSNSAIQPEFPRQRNSFLRVCLPVQLYQSSDKCLNEIEFMFMKELGMSILPQPWVLQTLHPVRFTNYDKPWNFCINDASEDADSEDIHLGSLAFTITWEEWKTLPRGVAGRKSIR